MLNPKQLNFLRRAAKAAVRSERLYDVPAELTVAQAILESGWGRHAPGNNCFGIKAAKRHQKTQTLTTREVYGGKEQVVKAAFAVYDSLDGAFEDHARLLSQGRPYTAALKKYTAGGDLTTYIHEVARRYATDPKYPAKILSIIRRPEVERAIADARRPPLQAA